MDEEERRWQKLHHEVFDLAEACRRVERLAEAMRTAVDDGLERLEEYCSAGGEGVDGWQGTAAMFEDGLGGWADEAAAVAREAKVVSWRVARDTVAMHARREVEITGASWNEVRLDVAEWLYATEAPVHLVAELIDPENPPDASTVKQLLRG